MADVGFISGTAAQQAISAPLELHPNRYFGQKRESYFFDYVSDELIRRYGVKTVRSGGLTIKTTVDLDLQRKARASIAKDLSFPGAPSSAIVTIDPSNGYILTMASSAKYQDSKFNLAADGKRQPGSTFKIMALVAAVSRGVDPKSTSYASGPLQLGAQFENVVINCYGGRCKGGSPDLVQATLRSDNTVYVRLALDLGPKNVVKAARALGIKSELQGYPSETLGGLRRCCSPLEMANAYATIASGGWRNKPKAITEVRFPDGNVEDLSKPQRFKAFDSAAMYEVTKILEANIKGGTGQRANIGCPAGGKTGTTENNANAWFVGYTPKLATAVWVGFPKANIPMGNLFGGRSRRRRHVPRADLGSLHEARQAQLLRAVRQARPPVQGQGLQAQVQPALPAGGAVRPEHRSRDRQTAPADGEAGHRHDGRRRPADRPAADAAPAAAGRRRHRSRGLRSEPERRAGPRRSRDPRRRRRSPVMLRPHAATVAAQWPKKRKSNSRAKSSKPCRTRCSA